MDKLIEKLSEILAKLGLDENAIESVIAELSDVANEEAVEEDSAPSGDPTDPSPEEAVPPLPPEEVVNEASTEEQNSDVPADEVPPAKGELPPESDPVPPAEPAPQVPPFDPSELINQINDLGAKLEEQVKANEGLLARISSLEEALKGAGVIDGESTASQVGDPNPSTAPGNPTEDVFQNVLDDLNGRKRF